MIRPGSRGPRVKSLQKFLIDLGFLPDGEDDGIAGRKTDIALKSYQVSRALVADGIFGPASDAAAKEDGWLSSTEPTPAQIDAANELDIPVAVIQTIQAVESNGKPESLRFEIHVFLRKRPDLEGELPYTPGPRGYSVTRSESDKGAFERAFALDPVSATESTSFGLYQVLGGHLIKIYGSPAGGVDSFYADPISASYKLLVSWFKDSPRATRAARQLDWDKLARYYNGPGQVDFYGAALRREYAKVVA